MLGLGTRELTGQLCRKQIAAAVSLGYRHIDTNPYFGNEMMIAEGFKNIPREELFITSKIPSYYMDYNESILSVKKTLKTMKLEYLDLVLIESPGKAEIKAQSHMHRTYRHRTWRALNKMKGEGLTRNIGVANYFPKHIDEIWDKHENNPVVNQFEFHPMCFSEELYQYHKEKNIQIIAATPLARGDPELWNQPQLIAIRRKYGVTKAQILLRWAFQKGVAVIPKTTIVGKLEVNTKIEFQIDEEDMKILDSLSSGKRVGWITEIIK